jgi:hypothetical protein
LSLTSDLSVLDPNVKLAYADDKWENKYKNPAVKRLEQVVSDI